jgi:hypothetical protein
MKQAEKTYWLFMYTTYNAFLTINKNPKFYEYIKNRRCIYDKNS